MISAVYFNLIISGFFYLLASFLYGVSFFKPDSRWEAKGFACIRIGFLGASIFLGLEAWKHGYSFPILNFSHVIAFFSWALAFLYLIPLMRLQTQSFGLILAPVLFVLNLASVLHSGDATYPLEVSIYFALHIIFAFFAYAAFTLSFTAALLYLIQQRELKKKNPGTFYHKLPNLDALDSLSYVPMALGAALLACAIAVGLFWAKDTYGYYWLNDPKTWLTLMTLILYSFLIFLRFGAQTRKSRLAFIGLLVFIFMIMSFVGGRYLNGKHSSALSETPASDASGQDAV